MELIVSCRKMDNEQLRESIRYRMDKDTSGFRSRCRSMALLVAKLRKGVVGWQCRYPNTLCRYSMYHVLLIVDAKQGEGYPVSKDHRWTWIFDPGIQHDRRAEGSLQISCQLGKLHLYWWGKRCGYWSLIILKTCRYSFYWFCFRRVKDEDAKLLGRYSFWPQGAFVAVLLPYLTLTFQSSFIRVNAP